MNEKHELMFLSLYIFALYATIHFIGNVSEITAQTVIAIIATLIAGTIAIFVGERQILLKKHEEKSKCEEVFFKLQFHLGELYNSGMSIENDAVFHFFSCEAYRYTSSVFNSLNDADRVWFGTWLNISNRSRKNMRVYLNNIRMHVYNLHNLLKIAQKAQRKSPAMDSIPKSVKPILTSIKGTMVHVRKEFSNISDRDLLLNSEDFNIAKQAYGKPHEPT